MNHYRRLLWVKLRPEQLRTLLDVERTRPRRKAQPPTAEHWAFRSLGKRIKDWRN